MVVSRWQVYLYAVMIPTIAIKKMYNMNKEKQINKAKAGGLLSMIFLFTLCSIKGSLFLGKRIVKNIYWYPAKK